MLQGQGLDEMDPYIDILLAEDVLKSGAEAIISQLLAIGIGQGEVVLIIPYAATHAKRWPVSNVNRIFCALVLCESFCLAVNFYNDAL